MFHTATHKEVKEGLVTDIYFERTKKILEAKGIDLSVRAEFMAHGFPSNWPWAVLAGVEECAEVLKDLPVDVRVMREGTIFGIKQPVMEISGKYLDFGQYETALLGMICQASGIATMAARCKKAAGKKEVISFGARRVHPTIAPLIERNAYIGGCDGVSVGLGAKLAGIEPSGTMPHAQIALVLKHSLHRKTLLLPDLFPLLATGCPSISIISIEKSTTGAALIAVPTP